VYVGTTCGAAAAIAADVYSGKATPSATGALRLRGKFFSQFFFFFFDHSCILSGDPSLTFGECICIEELHIRGREGRTLV
jgi:hypothetical protein